MYFAISESFRTLLQLIYNFFIIWLSMQFGGNLSYIIQASRNRRILGNRNPFLQLQDTLCMSLSYIGTHQIHEASLNMYFPWFFRFFRNSFPTLWFLRLNLAYFHLMTDQIIHVRIKNSGFPVVSQLTVNLFFYIILKIRISPKHNQVIIRNCHSDIMLISTLQ